MDLQTKETRTMTNKTTLTKQASWFNPYAVNTTNGSYELKDIIFYKKDAELVYVGRGWFGNNNTLGTITFDIDGIYYRRKAKFDGKAFVMGKAGEAVLYLPFEWFKFTERQYCTNGRHATDSSYLECSSSKVDGVKFDSYQGQVRNNERIKEIKKIIKKLKAVYEDMSKHEIGYTISDINKTIERLTKSLEEA